LSLAEEFVFVSVIAMVANLTEFLRHSACPKPCFSWVHVSLKSTLPFGNTEFKAAPALGASDFVAAGGGGDGISFGPPQERNRN
jgi:hypothetical protein